MPAGGPREAGHVRRLLEVVAVVAVWMAIGELMEIDPGESSFGWKTNVYLLIGIPIVLAFQLWLARRPISDLWVRGGRPVGKRVAFRVIGVALAIYPLIFLIKAISDDPDGLLAYVAYALAAIAGAFAAAYSFNHFTRETLRYLLLCLATAGVIGVLPFLIDDVHTLTHPVAGHSGVDFLFGLESFWLYIASLFVMEEVAFRGAFDSHAQQEGDRRGLLTAVFIACLWGAWHAPLLGWDEIVGLVLYQGAVGTLLSIWWRRSRNLGVTAGTHALIDSIRNLSGEAP
jgi:hypothetical protein